MNDNVYYGPSSVIPDGYTAPVEKTGGRKKFIIIAIVLFVVAIVGIVVAIIIEDPGSNRDMSEFGEDAEHVEYDISEEKTGGEEPTLPKNQSLDFLKEYGINDMDIKTIQAKVNEAVDKRYYNYAYNYVLYDTSTIQKDKIREQLIFFYSIDTDTARYRVALDLGRNNQVKGVTITRYD